MTERTPAEGPGGEPVAFDPAEPWTRHGQLGNEWWSNGEFEARMNRGTRRWDLTCNGTPVASLEYLVDAQSLAAEMAAHPAPAEPPINEWRQAIEDAMICWEMCIKEGETPKQALNRLLWMEQQVALDPKVSEDAVKFRDAVLEEAAAKATSFLVGDPANGIPLRNPLAHEVADAIRSMKSKP